MVYLDKYLSDLASAGGVWTIGYQIEKFMSTYPTASDGHNELRKLLMAFICNDGVISEPEKEKIDWLAGGLCLVEGSPLQPVYRLAETLVFTALDKFLLQQKVSLIPPLIKQLVETKPDDAYCGAIFDQIITVALREAARHGRVPIYLRHILKHLDWSDDTVPGKSNASPDGITNVMLHKHLSLFLAHLNRESVAEILMLAKNAMPDVHVKRREHTLIGDKVTFQLTSANNRRSVDSRERFSKREEKQLSAS